MNNNKPSSVEWLENELKERYPLMNSEPLFEQAKAMQQEQAQQYAEFCVMCDRNNLPLLDFESFILTYGGNK
jgi:hypothetical protein